MTAAATGSMSLVDGFVDALLRADGFAARRITERALGEGLSPIEVYETVYRPALYEIGARWERNELSVTAEHIATALTEAEMTRVFRDLYAGERTGRRALVGSIEGDHHRVGARMVADCFQAEGWDTYFAGGDTPIDDMLDFVDDLDPQAVALSLTVASRLSGLLLTIARLSTRFPDLWILVGGQGLIDVPHTALATTPRIRVVPDLVSLGQTIRWIVNSPDADLHIRYGAASNGFAAAMMTELATELRRLTLPHAAVADAIEANAARLAVEVSDDLRARPDIHTLIGPGGLRMMRDNHEHHVLFMSGWLRLPEPDLLLRRLSWSIRTHRAHGFSLAYWDAQFQAMQAAYARHLLPEQLASLQRLYRWMSGAVPRLAQILDHA